MYVFGVLTSDLRNGNPDFSEFTSLNKLGLQTVGVKICVKVMMIWNVSYQSSPDNIVSVDMIFIDQKGNKICCSVKKNVYDDHQHVLKEGNFVEIINFGVKNYTNEYRLVDNNFIINFFQATKVRRIAPFEETTDGFNPLPFVDIQEWKVPFKVAFDVVGLLVSNDPLRINMENGKTTQCINFVLQDALGIKVNCVLWGDYALQLSRCVENNINSTQEMIIAIQNARLKKYQDKPQVTNQWFGCRLHFNSNIPAIAALKSSLAMSNHNGLSLITSTQLQSNTVVKTVLDDFKKEVFKTVEELKETNQISTCSLKTTVVRLVHEEGWFYKCCVNCTSGAELDGISTEAIPIYDCINCGKITKVTNTARAIVRVKDESGSTTLVFFDSQLAKLLGKSIPWINNKLKKTEDPYKIPNEFIVLEKMEIACIVKVTDWNLKKHSPSYTVVKQTFDREVLSFLNEKILEKNEQQNALLNNPENPLTKDHGDGDEDTQGDDSVGEITPAALKLKRKSESPPDAPEPSSSKSVKIEGMSDLKISLMDDLNEAV